MSTLSTMKSRIADELARSDLTSQIADAIASAIERYQPDRFWFNESRAVTLTTSAGQSDYTTLSGDVTSTANLYSIDYMLLVIGNQSNCLCRMEPERIEYLLGNGPNNNRPSDFAYYNQTIRLYPPPSDAWTVRIGGHILKTAPASDSETGNVWMVEAERLIRARAKYELALHVLRDAEMATAMAAAVSESYDQLKRRTAAQTGTGLIRPVPF